MMLEIKSGIRVTIHNNDTAMSCYYSEDDWNIEAVGPTYAEAIFRIIPEYITSGIHPDGTSVERVKYVTYKDKEHVIETEDEDIGPSRYGIESDIKGHLLFEKLSGEKKEREEKRRAKEGEEIRKENEKSERELLRKLSKKYGFRHLLDGLEEEE